MAEQRDYVAIAEGYARDVVGKKIPACKWVRLACQRHLKDLTKSRRKAYPFRFDAAKAVRACKFIEMLPHTKGKWAAHKELLKLEPWQAFIVCCVFGWVKKGTGPKPEPAQPPNELRRFRIVFLVVPRKNGKSPLAAAIGVYMFTFDKEFGAEVYSGATNEKQAWEIFRPARLMIDRTPALKAKYGIEVGAGTLQRAVDGSRFEPVIGKPGDGASPSCALHDEYHEHADRDQVDTMETGMAAREQPLQVIVTTAGDNLAGPCYADIQDHRQVLEGVRENDELFYIEYTIDTKPYTEMAEWDDALRRLDGVCTCGLVKPTLIGELAREAFAALATTGSSGKKTRSTPSASAPTVAPGIIAIGINAASPPDAGARSRAIKKKSATTNLPSSSASPEPNMMNSFRSSAAAAQSATLARTCAWIIATLQGMFGASFADNATARSVFWGILRKVYNAHSTTCAVRGASLRKTGVSITVPADDWKSEAALVKANPNLGVSVNTDFLRARLRDAIATPRKAAVYKTKHLNQWVSARAAYFDVEAWRECADPAIPIRAVDALALPELRGRRCNLGLDLASKVDIAALEYLIQPMGERPTPDDPYIRIGRYFVPADRVALVSHYQGWDADGLLDVTPGEIIDYDEIEQAIMEATSLFQVEHVAYDPHQATQLSTRLMKEGVPVIEYRPIVLNFSEPMKELDALMKLKGNPRGRRVRHGGDPVMEWQISNVVAQPDKKDNVYPTKPRDEAKIDSPVALMSALGVSMTAEAAPKSFWEAMA